MSALRRRPFALAWLLAAAAIAGCGGGGVPSNVDDSRETVPSVVGMTVREAEALLFRSSLRWRYEGSDVIRSTPLDESTHTSGDGATVVRQSPPAGAEIGPDGVVVLALAACSPPPGAACM